MSCKRKVKPKRSYNYDMMMQINMYDCNINSMNMMMDLAEDEPVTPTLYKITAKDPGSEDIYNLKIDDSGIEPKIVLTKDATNTMWTIMGDLNVVNPFIAIERPGMDQYWTVVDDVPWITFRPIKSMGNVSQFFVLNSLEDEQFFFGRVRTEASQPPMFVGSSTNIIQEGSVIYSDGTSNVFIITPVG